MRSALGPYPLTLPRDPTRSPSLHLSTIIHDLAATLEPGRFSRDEKGETEDLNSEPRIWLGQASDLLLRQTRPGIPVGEMEKDGVTLTCDNLSLLNEPARAGLMGDHLAAGDWIVEEFKLTWLSSRHELGSRKLRHYLWQLMGYCWAWETVRARLIIYYVNGNYAPPSPTVVVHELLFDYQELKQNWEMLLRHARSRGWLPKARS